MKKSIRSKILASLAISICATSAQAATYCGWINDAKFGATLTDKLGVHSLSTATATGNKVNQIEESMKEWPSCGCITGTLDRDGDFLTIAGFKLKSIAICKADKSLSAY